MQSYPQGKSELFSGLDRPGQAWYNSSKRGYIMVRLRNPCFSGSASGKLGDAIIFVTRYGRTHAKRYFMPGNPNTPAQQVPRNRMASAQARWKIATDETKAAWKYYITYVLHGARRAGITAPTAYSSAFMIYMRDNAEAEPAAPFLPPE